MAVIISRCAVTTSLVPGVHWARPTLHYKMHWQVKTNWSENICYKVQFKRAFKSCNLAMIPVLAHLTAASMSHSVCLLASSSVRSHYSCKVCCGGRSVLSTGECLGRFNVGDYMVEPGCRWSLLRLLPVRSGSNAIINATCWKKNSLAGI